MTKVYIVHASDDLWVAKQIAQCIRDCGADTFLDCEQVQCGDDFEQRIVDEALTCTETLVLFTPAAHDRRYVWMEIGMFFGAKKRIVGVLYGTSVQEISSDERMPALLKRVNLININDLDSYLSQLCARVKADSGIEKLNNNGDGTITGKQATQGQTSDGTTTVNEKGVAIDTSGNVTNVTNTTTANTTTINNYTDPVPTGAA